MQQQKKEFSKKGMGCFSVSPVEALSFKMTQCLSAQALMPFHWKQLCFEEKIAARLVLATSANSWLSIFHANYLQYLKLNMMNKTFTVGSAQRQYLDFQR